MKQFLCVFAAAVLTGLFSTAASAHHRWYGYGYGYGYGWGGPYYYGGPTVVYGGPVYWGPGYWGPPVYYRPRWRRTVIYAPTYWYGGGYWGPRW